ncbi:MAG: sigma 54-interacting transcriptional regulator, partial [Planctomycetota bacterium]
WNMMDPAAVEGDAEEILHAFRASRDEIERLVNDLFDRGYLDTLFLAKRRTELILDSMAEGIIVHDTSRRIIFFNKAAERITGYEKEEVIDRDCHDIFPGNFCGPQCSFCKEGDDLPDSGAHQKVYSLQFVDKSGETHDLEMSVHPIIDPNHSLNGVLASFRDLTRELRLARRLGEIEQFSGIIGRDKKMQEVFDLIRSVADTNVPVMIQGDSGTGKELVAAAIHNESHRKNKLFVPLNCGALPEGLLESELFGHVRGAFTGAIRDKKGRFELAHEGTIFLDEIGDISLAMQVKLLRVLQEGKLERVGSTQTIKVDARVISATNKDLKAEIKAGRFREDLFYRLCVLPIHLPPLRERGDDISLLVNHFLKQIAAESGQTPKIISPGSMSTLLSYGWPGNVRELQNALQFALVKCKGDVIEVNHLPPNILNSLNLNAPAIAALTSKSHRGRKMKLSADDVQNALKTTKGNKSDAAKLLNVGRATLYRFLSDHAELME